MSNPTTITAHAGLPFVDVTREFDASVAAVFRAHVDPDLFRQWTGPRSLIMDSLELDARSGGRWHYSFHHGEDPVEYRFGGVFHAVKPNHLIVQTFEFNLAPDQVGLGTLQFEDLDGGRSRLVSREVYPSVEARDMALASGMDQGIRESYERLDELVAAGSPSSTAHAS